VWIDNLNCDGNPNIDCPLDFDEPSGSCGSVERPLKKGDTQTIGAFDVGPGMGGRCKQEKRPDTWGYDIKVRTITPPSIGTADPQLVIVRDGLTKFLDSIESMLRSLKRLLHL
jgi:hypothetical protein